jgi:hypothetical protein
MSSGQAYVGTAKRTFSHAVVHLLETSYRLLGSRRVLELIAQDVKTLAEQFFPAPERLRSGWMVFTGVKATGPKARPAQSAADHELLTLAWPVLVPEDFQALATMPKGLAGKRVRQALLQRRITRIVEYGWQHPDGPVLLTLADLGAMLNLQTPRVSQLLKAARKATGKPLLTKGYYFDQGMRPTHKDAIIALYESGLDEADIARQTQHDSVSVGKYIRDYERVKRLLKEQYSIERIVYFTELQPNVVKAYVGMTFHHHPDLAAESVSLAQI